MALDKPALKDALEAWMSATPATKAASANALADLYATYATGAADCSGSPPGPLTVAKATLSAALLASFSGTNPASTAAAWATAFTAFWLLPPVTFPPAGVVTLVTGTALLQSGLISLWAVNVATKAQAAQGHADILDLFTKSVVAANAPALCTAPIV